MDDYEIGRIGPFGFDIDYDPMSGGGIKINITHNDHKIKGLNMTKGTEKSKVYAKIQDWCEKRVQGWLVEIQKAQFEFYCGGPECSP